MRLSVNLTIQAKLNMEKELENTANEALRAIIDNAAAAKDFILAELPEVVQQLLMWKMAHSIVMCLFSVSGFLISFLIIRWQLVNSKTHLESQIVRDSEGAVYMANVFLILPLAVGFACWNLTWLKIWIAPKVYLLEYAAALVR